ncbi:glucose 1-dehydrogenase [Lichenibacterium minor]|uniref:Glucose 1-dehydrogenase n=1 Tax=Lichenibacterium minor TaxID=2316528 RepID=A0A4Q2U7R8_9HYPH|nr:glucose 1-dehydrogenase [Lichenibacterium minor]RYC32442.1 glucose 1-dehydrogenase [Lichenibacterium minor]
MRLAGKTALVTGAASGFGAEIARVFAREGAKVLILDLDGPGAEAVAAGIGPAARAVAGDVTRRADVDRALDAAAELDGGAFDVVVNNAGWTHRNKPLLEVTEDEFDRVYAINVKSIFHMVSAAVPRMKGRGGAMINVGSTAGIRPRPGLTWYNSTKGAVNLLTRSLAVELAPERIRVNCIAPVMGATGLLESFMGMPDTPENRARFIAGIPLGRLSEPKDIANAALYLASDEAEFITGVILEVDGGRTI